MQLQIIGYALIEVVTKDNVRCLFFKQQLVAVQLPDGSSFVIDQRTKSLSRTIGLWLKGTPHVSTAPSFLLNSIV